MEEWTAHRRRELLPCDPALDLHRALDQPLAMRHDVALEATTRTKWLLHGVEWVVVGDMDLTELLSEAHKPAARHREVVADPNLEADLPRLTLVGTVDPDRGLLVLRALGVDERHVLLGIPDGPPATKRNVGHVGLWAWLERCRQIRGDHGRVGAVRNVEVLRCVVPRHVANERGLATWRQWIAKSLEIIDRRHLALLRGRR